MSYNRSLDYLNHRHIIYRTIPKDKLLKNMIGVYTMKMVHMTATIYSEVKLKLLRYKSLKWHLLVLWYLNPKL